MRLSVLILINLLRTRASSVFSHSFVFKCRICCCCYSVVVVDLVRVVDLGWSWLLCVSAAAHRYRQLAANIRRKMKAREVQRDKSGQGDDIGARGGSTAANEPLLR